MSELLKNEIERGIELLWLCQDLQSEKDGVDRPGKGQIDKSKTLDEFAMDINQAATNMSMLHLLFPMMEKLSELGRKLESDGKLEVCHGDRYDQAALKFVLEQSGIQVE